MLKPGEKVLIVDNMVTIRKLISKICVEIGMPDVLEASDVGNAWEVINTHSESLRLIISEWEMPNGNGMDLLKRLRTDNRFMKLPFIMLSTVSDPKQIQEVMKFGDSNFITKPFTAAILAEKITLFQKK